MKPSLLRKIVIPEHLRELVPYLSEIYAHEADKLIPLNSVKLSKQLSNCLDKIPATIFDLKDGKLYRYFEIKLGQEAELGALGFKLNLSSVKKAMVIEYFQMGSHICNDRLYQYGVGARMLLKVESKKMGAKLASPQQITASVIFNKASVSYEWRTFGITGPSVDAYFGAADKLNENTCSNFVQAVAKLFSEAYRKDKNIVIFPQPLVIKS